LVGKSWAMGDYLARTSESSDSRLKTKEQPGTSREQWAAPAAIPYDVLFAPRKSSNLVPLIAHADLPSGVYFIELLKPLAQFVTLIELASLVEKDLVL